MNQHRALHPSFPSLPHAAQICTAETNPLYLSALARFVSLSDVPAMLHASPAEILIHPFRLVIFEIVVLVGRIVRYISRLTKVQRMYSYCRFDLPT